MNHQGFVTEVNSVSKSSQQRPRGFFARIRKLYAWIKGIILWIQSPDKLLPNIQYKTNRSGNLQIKFKDVNGLVSRAKSEAILMRAIGKNTGATALQQHLACEQAVNNEAPWILGNKLVLLQNGPETYQAMMAGIRAATDHINLETYIFDDDEIGNKFADLLLERQAAGVQVNVIYDSVGSIVTPRAFFDRLSENGIRVLEFNPLNPMIGNKNSWRFNNRDHRKQLVIDGRIAFVGGINISKTYSSAPKGRRSKKQRDAPDISSGWRDTHLQIEGPVVAEFQKLFIDTWSRQQGEPLASRNYFPLLTACGTEILRAIGCKAEDPRSKIYLTVLSAIHHAQEKICLNVAYFAPDPQLLKALVSAARRGVEVKLVLPGYSDNWAVFHLGRSYYTKLLRGGVNIYERSDAVMHAKTMSIDNVWSTIGSANLDWRSFLHNDEINAVILGRDFAKQMEIMFVDDLKESQPILLSRWRQRSWILRLKERLARTVASWL